MFSMILDILTLKLMGLDYTVLFRKYLKFHKVMNLCLHTI